LKAVELVEADGGLVIFGDVKPEDLGGGGNGGGFDALKEFSGDAALAVGGCAQSTMAKPVICWSSSAIQVAELGFAMSWCI